MELAAHLDPLAIAMHFLVLAWFHLQDALNQTRGCLVGAKRLKTVAKSGGSIATGEHATTSMRVPLDPSEIASAVALAVRVVNNRHVRKQIRGSLVGANLLRTVANNGGTTAIGELVAQLTNV